MRNDIGFKVDAGFEEGDENGNLVYTGGGPTHQGGEGRGKGSMRSTRRPGTKEEEGRGGSHGKVGPGGWRECGRGC